MKIFTKVTKQEIPLKSTQVNKNHPKTHLPPLILIAN
ncbi:unnamed protein product, partial [Gulo gulo]